MRHNTLFFPIFAGVIFFAFNAYYNYDFYHVNSFKMVYMGVFVLCCFFVYDVAYLGYNRLIQKKTIIGAFPWKEALLFLLPVLGTYPGFLLHFDEYLHYNHKYELAIELIALLWMVYLIRFLTTDKPDKAIITFLLFVGTTMIYVWFFGILETKGLSPYTQGFAARIKVTYGNINYLAGSLVPILPIFLLLAIPKIQIISGSINFEKYFSKTKHILFLLFFLASSHALLLTKTRAAIAAGFVSCLIVLLILLAQIFLRKKRHLLLLLFSAIIAVLMFLFICFFYREELSGFSRFFRVFYFATWQGRFIAWLPAISAFFESPIFGYGLGTSYALFFRNIAPDSRIFWGQRSYNHAHSEWIEYLAEGGIFGYICFFILWGYVFYHLTKLFFYTQKNILHQRIILGCAAGMLGFFMHGLFSVSQRMIVTNIPQYALLAIAFVLIAYYKKELQVTNSFFTRFKKIVSIYKIWLAKWSRLPSLVRNQLPVGLIITLICALYINWALTQYRFVKITKEGKSLVQTIKFEKLKDKRKDIYLMDALTRRYLEFKDYKKALINIQQTHKIIPRYRINGFLEALSYYYLRDTNKAYTLLKEYLKLDNYYHNALSLTHRLSYFYNDTDTFLLTLKYIFEEKTAQRGRRERIRYWDFTIDKSQTKNVIFKELKTKNKYFLLKISFSKQYFNQIYGTINAHVKRQSSGKPSLDSAIKSLSSEILSAAIEEKYIEFIPLANDADTKNRVQKIMTRVLSHNPLVELRNRDWSIEFAKIIKNTEVKARIEELWEGLRNIRRAIR